VYDVILAVLAATLAGHARSVTGRWAGPIPIFFLSWAAVTLGHLALPLHLHPTTGGATLVVGLGLLSVFIGFLLAHQRGDPLADLAVRELPWPRWWTFTVLIATATGVGLVAFRRVIATVSGSNFSDLSQQQVLYYQIYGPKQWGGLTLLMGLTVVLAALGVVAAAHHRSGFLLVAVALAVAVQSPARTLPVTLTGVACVLWLYVRPTGRPASRVASTPVRWRQRGIALGVLAIVGLLYFNAEGSAVKKNVGAPQSLGSLTAPSIYATGSLSALSVAIDEDASSVAQPLRSLWILPRAWALAFPDTLVPDPVAGFVSIPDPYNTYTMFGDLYFDFGLTGVVVGSSLFAFLVERAHARATSTRALSTGYVAAVLVTLLFGGIVAMRLFWLDTVLWLVVGIAIFETLGARVDTRRRRCV